jgi:ankyrin repeat protein
MPISPLIKALQRENELIEAAKNADYEKVKLLLEEGVNVNAMDKKGETALHFPAWAGYIRVCRLLIEKGANLDAKDKYDQTPLMLSARGGKSRVCYLLLSKGADANATNTSGATAMKLAGALNHHYTVQLLNSWAMLPNLLGDGFTAFRASFAECIA